MTSKASKNESLFKGMSTLRAEERKREAQTNPKPVNAAMAEYLRK
jgi:hypothetical protein